MGKLKATAKAVGDALDMSREARMQRARDMGFDVDNPVYHGTDRYFSEFDPERSIGGQYWSTTDRAAVEAGEVGAQGRGVVREMYQRIQNPAGWEEYDKFGVDELIARGYDGLRLPESDGTATYVAFEPNQYRDVNAAFDPAKKDFSNLLAGGAAAAVGLGAASQSDEADAGVITKGGKRLIEAFHGSPHTFGRFSMENIGTGEGAQAYGHGLYFADDIDVAKNYQPRSDAAESVMLDRYNAAVNAEDYESAEIWEAAMLHQTPAEIRQTFNADDYGEEFAAKASSIADEISELPAQGMLVKVHIDADPDTLLDWDAPLSEQPESVQRALKQLPDKLVREQIFGRDKWGAERGGGEIYAILQDYFRNGRPDNIFDGGTGALGQSDASGELKSLGIPGIKYFDAGSRGRGKGSRNYVMFDDAPISIQERGIATPEMLAATALSASAYNFMQAQDGKREKWAALRQQLSQVAEKSISALDMPWRGLLGLSRVGGGLLGGESFGQAMNAGASQVRQPIEQTAYDLGAAASDYTGSPAIGAAVNTAVQVGGPI